MFFTKGTLFYTEYQVRLLVLLLTTRFDVLHSNDLDTLLPNYFAAKIKRKHIVYDTHEYFTEVPELQHNPLKKRIWLAVEKFVFPKLKYVFTVNQSIASIYQKIYGVPVKVMRNVPLKAGTGSAEPRELSDNLKGRKYIILQGAGINIDRGSEELVEAMHFVTDAVLLIVGDGDVIPSLKDIVQESGLSDKVFFLGKQPYDTLMGYTKNALIGITLDKDTNLNYRYSLPNKIFDYVRAGIPVLASPLTETKNIFNEYEIGCLVENHLPGNIAAKINYMISDKAPVELWKKNLYALSAITNWENESIELLNVYAEISKKA